MARVLLGVVEKALTHKYKARIPKPGGGYRYIYDEPTDPRSKKAEVDPQAPVRLDSKKFEEALRDPSLVAGAVFSVGDDTRYTVKSVSHDGIVSYTSKDGGSERVLPAPVFRSVVLLSHKAAFQRFAHDGLFLREAAYDLAQSHGTPAQQQKAHKALLAWSDAYAPYLGPLEQKAPAAQRSAPPSASGSEEAFDLDAPPPAKPAPVVPPAKPPSPPPAKPAPATEEKEKTLDDLRRESEERIRRDLEKIRAQEAQEAQEKEALEKEATSVYLPDSMAMLQNYKTKKFGNRKSIGGGDLSSEAVAVRAERAGKSDGWKEYYKDRFLDPDDSQFVKKYSHEIKEMWSKYGVVLSPATADSALSEEMLRKHLGGVKAELAAASSAIPDFRKRIAECGLSVCFEGKEGSVFGQPGQHSGASALYRPSESRIVMYEDSGSGYTLRHELFHALDHHASGRSTGELFTQTNESLVPENRIPFRKKVSMSPGRLEYLELPSERAARTFEGVMSLADFVTGKGSKASEDALFASLEREDIAFLDVSRDLTKALEMLDAVRVPLKKDVREKILRVAPFVAKGRLGDAERAEIQRILQ